MEKKLLVLIAVLGFYNSFAQIADYVPQNGLVLYLPFNNSYQDLSATNATITQSGGSFGSDQFGNTNSVYTCTQEQNLEINLTTYPSIKSSGDFSVSLWVNYTGVLVGTSTGNYPTFIEYGDELYLRYFEKSPTFMVQGGYRYGSDSRAYYGPSYTIANLQEAYSGWKHIAYTKNATTENLYINGVAVQQSNSLGIPLYNPDNNTLEIGGERGASLNDLKRFAGSLDDIAMYNRSLTATEVSDLYQGYIESNITNAAYLSFDGVANHIEIETPLNLNSNNVLIEAMVYIEAGTMANDGIIVSRDGNTVAGIIVTLEYPDSVKLGYIWNGLYFNWLGGLNVSINEWHHVSLYITPTVAILRVDNRIARHEAIHVIEEFDGKLILGGDPYSGYRYFKGKLDEVAIWNNPDIGVINRISNNNKCPLDPKYYPSLVAYYTFNQGHEISPTIAPSIVKDAVGLRDGVLKSYPAQPVNSWSLGGPTVYIDNTISVDESTLTVAEKAGSRYIWQEKDELFAVFQSTSTNSYSPTKSGTYYAMIEKDGCSLYTDMININLTITSFDNEDNNLSAIQFYPNPSNGLVKLNKEADKIAVYNNFGILQLVTSGREIDLRGFAKGTYLIKIENNKQNSAHQLLIK